MSGGSEGWCCRILRLALTGRRCGFDGSRRRRCDRLSGRVGCAADGAEVGCDRARMLLSMIFGSLLGVRQEVLSNGDPPGEPGFWMLEAIG